MLIGVLVACYVLLACLNGVMAWSKGLSSGSGTVGVIVLSLVFTPIPGFFLIMVMSARGPSAERAKDAVPPSKASPQDKSGSASAGVKP